MESARLSGAAFLQDPIACTEAERQAFARLVRQGFPRARALKGRIRAAHCLAFHYAAGDKLVAIAAIKAPDESYRRGAFRQADASASAQDYPLELGWVFVTPGHRRSGLAEGLCRALVKRASTSGLFATTRPDNERMIRILRALGFARVGRPYPKRDEELVLLVRPPERGP